MPVHPHRRLAPWVAGIVILAGAPRARATDWLPLGVQVRNGSAKEAVLKIVGHAPWRLGYQAGSGAPGRGEPAAAPEGLLVPAHKTVALLVAKPEVETKAASLWLALVPPGAHVGDVDERDVAFTLDLHAPGAPAALNAKAGARERRGTQFCLCLPGLVVILDRGGDPSHALEPKSVESPPGPRTLPELKKIEMEAGDERPDLNYTCERLGAIGGDQGLKSGDDQWARELHARAHLMPEEDLGDYFCNTFFQFYTRIALNVDPRVDYGQYPALARFSKADERWLDGF